MLLSHICPQAKEFLRSWKKKNNSNKSKGSYEVILNEATK